MAAPRLTLSMLVLLLAVVAMTEGLRGAGRTACCSRFTKKIANWNNVVSYTRTSQRCRNPGVFLKTVKGDKLCVRASESWVWDLIKHVDAKSARPGETSNL